MTRETCPRCHLVHDQNPEPGAIDFEASPEAHESASGLRCIEAQALAMRTLLEALFPARCMPRLPGAHLLGRPSERQTDAVYAGRPESLR